MKVDYFKFIFWLAKTGRITFKQYQKALRFIRANKLQSAKGEIVFEKTNIKEENGEMYLEPTLFDN